MLQTQTRTHPPTVDVKPKLQPVPEIFCSINQAPETIRSNIEKNIQLGLPQVVPYETQEDKVIALALGGATLDTTFDDLKNKHDNGMPVVTVNGTYKYCMDRGIRPSAFIMLDSREFNHRFIHKTHQDCKYLICSQCDPYVFEKLKDNQVWIWHCAGQEDNEDLLKGQYNDDFYPVMGGSTVALRAIHLLRLLGFNKFEVYGFDSCVIGHHHAYEQKENDEEDVIDVIVADKEFKCTAANYHQAKEFVQMIIGTGEHYNLAIHGDGLISHIIKNPDSLRKKEEVN
tara:strand:+ start:1127 stop:1981 length:855 start_codon:yes stop_codon:yes gene_type:complete